MSGTKLRALSPGRCWLALSLGEGLGAVAQGTITRPGFGAVDRVRAHA